MARQKKPENENTKEAETRHILENMANVANRSEKTSWNRKMDNLVKFMTLLEPVESKILEIIRTEKTPLMDDLSELRKVMVKECVHPFEYLVMGTDESSVTCKFCNCKISVMEWMTK